MRKNPYIQKEVITKEILTPDEVMQILSIKRNFFDRLRKEGKILTYKIGNRVYVKHSELMALVDAGAEHGNRGTIARRSNNAEEGVEV